ncbi:MAG: hypothetical protein HC825_07805 [Oscillatoriales cyanobacterium RM1_1_9]|nr:hypothetical protein [Oscillatoriales cyanobacterium RM1_1_9]
MPRRKEDSPAAGICGSGAGRNRHGVSAGTGGAAGRAERTHRRRLRARADRVAAGRDALDDEAAVPPSLTFAAKREEGWDQTLVQWQTALHLQPIQQWEYPFSDQDNVIVCAKT